MTFLNLCILFAVTGLLNKYLLTNIYQTERLQRDSKGAWSLPLLELSGSCVILNGIVYVRGF